MTHGEAEDRFLDKFGPVNAIRLIGYAFKLDIAGEEWLREHVSRQQLAFIRAQFAEAGVPWGPGLIEWQKPLKALIKTREDALAKKAATSRKKAHRGATAP